MEIQQKIKALEKILSKSKEIQNESSSDPTFKSWKTLVERTLIKVFGNNSFELEEFRKLKFFYQAIVWTTGTDYSNDHLRVFRKDLETTIKMIDSYIEEFRDEIEENIQDTDSSEISKILDVDEKVTTLSNKIFIVHGHNNEMKESVARVLEKLSLKPIILHEQANKGRTIIQKFSDHSSNVSFAIILLSPDDIGYSKDEKPEKPIFRARQNVIFEMGFFFGKLGFDRVVAIYKKINDFELPSDYDGVLYIPFDNSGAWKTKLIIELKEVGFEVSADDLI